MVGSGCGGAIPNLQVAESLLKTNGGGVVVSASVEICSTTFQMDNDLSLILSNALFGDGAAAAVLWNQPAGFELVASAGRYVPEQRESIRFVHKKGQLFNQLSLRLPDLVKKAAAEVVNDVLSAQGLRGCQPLALYTEAKIINAVRDELWILRERRASRKVLAEYGNMSSHGVVRVDEIRQNGIFPATGASWSPTGRALAHAFLLKIK
jgi:predicted naringenin-chalcone synthase